MLDLHVFNLFVFIFDMISCLTVLPRGSFRHRGILKITLVWQLLVLNGRRPYHQLLNGLKVNFLMQVIVRDHFALIHRLPKDQLLSRSIFVQRYALISGFSILLEIL